jgi:transcriptional regulator with PAS, ATPase and Fis domain
MKNYKLYHLMRKSDFIYALTNGEIRQSQLLAAIKELEKKIVFDEIECILSVDEEYFDEILDSIRSLSQCMNRLNLYSTGPNIIKKVSSEIMEENIAYNIQTSPDGLVFPIKSIFNKRKVDKLLDLTEKFYCEKIQVKIIFKKIENLTDEQSGILQRILEERRNKNIYIIHDLTGEVFKDFYEYKASSQKDLNFIINKNEYPIAKPNDYNFNKNIFGTEKVPVNNLLKIRKIVSATQNSELPFHKILTEDKNLIEKLRYAKFLAEHDETVLILGETGTGKELLAEGIHYESKRYKGPFVAINCSAVPDSLFESELFGFEKGAFTGANTTKIGKMEEANGGTLFLDEIADLSPLHQAKVLRVLNDKKLTRIGGIIDIECDFRIICATNKDVQHSDFRSDLLYRIATFTFELPSLKERSKKDIALLVSHFTDSIKSKYLKYFSIEYSEKAIEILSNYHWPGNVRQLKSFVYETFFWTAYKEIPKFDKTPIKIKNPAEPIYDTAESKFLDKPNYQGNEPLFRENPIIIDDKFVKDFIEKQNRKEAKNKHSNSDLLSKITDENVSITELPPGFNINNTIDDLRSHYLKKLIKSGMNQTEIAEKFEVKQQTVSTWIKKYKLKFS